MCTGTTGTPSSETCDTTDQNCNGVADDLAPSTCTACTLPTGSCTAGTGECAVSGSFACGTAGAVRTEGSEVSSCAVMADGRLRCWGYNGYYNVGDGTTTQRLTPTLAFPSTLTAVTRFAGGYQHQCAVQGGLARCWGFNNYGQLGNNTTATGTTPQTALTASLTALSNVVEVAPGYYQTCALRSDATVWCWGYNGNGELGNGTATTRYTATQVLTGPSAPLTTVVAMGVGHNHGCAVRSNGSVWCWGYNNYGQLGNGTTSTRTYATQVTGITNAVADIALGQSHTCVRLSTGQVRCWGRGSEGQLGNALSGNYQTPQTVMVNSSLALSGVAQLTADMYQTCARMADGTARCWGWNPYGQLGDGTTTNRNVATVVTERRPGASSSITLANVVSIGSGHYHTCATLTDRTVRCWGRGDYGQLGEAALLNRSWATEVINLTDGVTCSADPSGSDGRTCTNPTGGVCENLSCGCADGSSNCSGVCQPTGATCTVGVGACARTGTTVCSGTGTACSATPGAPTAEICDGIDNDCDGTVDESVTQACYTGPGGTQNVGACRGGTQTCVVGGTGTWSACVGQVLPTTEICNGNVDDDCDGLTDEGNPGGGGSCTTSESGICAAGTRYCSGSLSSSSGWVRDWLVLGRFSNGLCGVETGVNINLTGNPANGQVENGQTWRTWSFSNGSCVACGEGIDLDCFYGADFNYVSAYLFSYVYSPVTQTVQLRTGSDDGLLVWLNGTLVFNGSTLCRGCAIDQDTTTVTLQAGLNRLVMKIGEAGGGWGGGARFTTTAGLPLTNLTYSLTPGSGQALRCGSNVVPTAEICDGLDNDCDGLVDEGFCRIGGGCYTNGDVNPSNNCQQCTVTSTAVSGPTSWAPRSNGTVCRPVAGPCDVAETCNGTGAMCPTDAFISGSAPGSATFSYTGGVQSWVVPAGVTSVTVDARGASGYGAPGPGGLGGRTQATLAVTPGSTIYVYVGGAGTGCGAGGFNGGGSPSNCTWSAGTGGGASDLRVGGTALSNRVIVAGGGGGGGYNCASNDAGGSGGGSSGGTGTQCGSTMGGGTGGTQTAGGAGGAYSGYATGTSGTLGQGGTSGSGTGGGGGGGGYYGGGGGSWGGGGGGSGFAGAGTSAVTLSSGVQTGNGMVSLSWGGGGSVCRPANGVCDRAEICNGTSAACPPDTVLPAGGSCPSGLSGSGSNGGSGATCLSSYSFNVVAGQTYTISTCADYTGDPYLVVSGACSCSNDDFCGTGAQCTCTATSTGIATICATSFSTSAASWNYTVTSSSGGCGTVCRTSAGICDVAETCNGVSTACPANGYAPSGNVCGSGSSSGYTRSTSPLSWVNACSGSYTNLVPNVDDSVANGTLPFNFRFYDLNMGAGYPFQVSSNGLLGFPTTTTSWGNNALSASGLTYTIAPFWDDLFTRDPGVCMLVEGAAPNRRLRLQWNNVRHFSDSGSYNFQVVLSEGSNTIDVLYSTMSGAYANGSQATIGIMRDSATFDQVGFNQAVVVTGSSFRWQLPTTQTCNGSGTCSSPPGYSQSFSTGVIPTSQCTAWNSWRASLSGSTVYSSVRLSGSLDPTGVVCTGSVANTICQALRTGTYGSWSCGGRTWNVGNCAVSGVAVELSANGDTCICSTGYIARPCIGNENWGGVNGSTCYATNQTINVQCQ